MHDEVLYSFTRGVGWVPDTGRFVCMFTDVTGTTYKVYKRMPEVGELWSAISSKDETIQDVLNWFTRNRFPISQAGKWIDGGHIYYKTYLTFVPVNA